MQQSIKKKKIGQDYGVFYEAKNHKTFLHAKTPKFEDKNEMTLCNPVQQNTFQMALIANVSQLFPL